MHMHIYFIYLYTILIYILDTHHRVIIYVLFESLICLYKIIISNKYTVKIESIARFA